MSFAVSRQSLHRLVIDKVLEEQLVDDSEISRVLRLIHQPANE
jgi:hypothetical protein